MKFLFLFFFASMLLVDFLSVATPAPPAQILDQMVDGQNAENIDVAPAKESLTRHKRFTCPWLPGRCMDHCHSKGFPGFCKGETCACKKY